MSYIKHIWWLGKNDKEYLYCIPCETFIQNVIVHECDGDHEDVSLFKVNHTSEIIDLLNDSVWWRWPCGYLPCHARPMQDAKTSAISTQSNAPLNYMYRTAPHKGPFQRHPRGTSQLLTCLPVATRQFQPYSPPSLLRSRS